MANDAHELRVVILAAGFGSRLGLDYPKPLAVLGTGQCILERQLRVLGSFVPAESVWIVVGYKKELIMEAFPNNVYIYNQQFNRTNTAKSLWRALSKCEDCDVLWLNGDVVLEAAVVETVLRSGRSAAAVLPGEAGAEEVKYCTTPNGMIRCISKQVRPAEGEAVGVNFVHGDDVPPLVTSLERCADGDYFERGMELAMEEGTAFEAADISGALCIEIDTSADLRRANDMLGARTRAVRGEGPAARLLPQATADCPSGCPPVPVTYPDAADSEQSEVPKRA